MALSTHYGNFTKSTGGAPASQSVTGVGFLPKALLLFLTAQTATGIAAGHRYSIGASDGTNDRANGLESVGTTVALAFHMSDNKALIILGGAGVLAQCDLTSFDADGFTLNWTTNNASAYIIHYLAIGGADLTNDYVSTFNTPGSQSTPYSQSITGVGFQPDVVIFFWTAMDTPSAGAANHIYSGLGFAVSSSQRAVMHLHSEFGVATSNTVRHQETIRCYILDDTTGAADEADFTSMDADGFTLSWTLLGTSIVHACSYIALKGGQYAVGNETQKTSTGTKATTGVGFQPTGLLLGGFNRTAAGTKQDHNRIAIGAASAAGTEGAIWAGDTDNVGFMSIDMSTVTNKVLRLIDTDAPSAADAEADLNSLDSDGFTLNWSTADAVAREFFYLAMGDTAAAAVPGSFGAVIG